MRRMAPPRWAWRGSIGAKFAVESIKGSHRIEMSARNVAVVRLPEWDEVRAGSVIAYGFEPANCGGSVRGDKAALLQLGELFREGERRLRKFHAIKNPPIFASQMNNRLAVDQLR